MSFMDFWNRASKWFNQTDRVHDIMRFGLGFTFIGILDTFISVIIPVFLWAIYVFAQETKDIIKWIKVGKFKKMWKDGIYDMAWAFSGVFLYGVLNYFWIGILIAFIIVCIIICFLYDKKVRYKE